MREIGSDFHWEASSAPAHSLPEAAVFTLSGRTALALALEDLGGAPGTALLPDWCCRSMVEPFRAAGYAVEFYPAGSSGPPPIPDRCTVLLRCGYFGYARSWVWETPTEFRRRGGVVIEDITHSLLSAHPAHGDSDYLVASLRKWGPLLSGGLCVKPGGRLKPTRLIPPSEEFLIQRRQAMELKAQYLRDGDPAKKALFRELFDQSGRWLADHWVGAAMDEVSVQLFSRWDVEQMRRRRRDNARILHDALAASDRVRHLWELCPGDCPLFVPVEVPGGGRDELQRRLAEQRIYCPVHWPRPQGCQNRLYHTELSLVCDQRYTADHMKRIIEVIHT